MKRVSLHSLIERKLALQWLRQRGLGVVQRASPQGRHVLEGPFYENRAMKRAQGERGHTYGYGAMAPSIKTRGRS
jgi:hypothetical protein